MPGLFITYEKVSATKARILTTATVMDPVGYAGLLEGQGTPFYFIPLDGHTGWFELENDQVVAMHTRDPFPSALDKPTVGLLEVATIPGVPACTVRISGPNTNGEIRHPGGDLQVRFALPGTYTLAFEAFPFTYFETKLTVKSAVKTEIRL